MPPLALQDEGLTKGATALCKRKPPPPTRTHARRRARTRARTHTRMLAHTHTHTHTHTLMQELTNDHCCLVGAVTQWARRVYQH